MSVLDKYKPKKVDPSARAVGKKSPRARLLFSLEKQLEMAELVAKGKPVPKTSSGKSTKTWWVEHNGTVFLQMYLGNSKMNFGKDLNALEIGEITRLPEAIREIMEGVEAGDFDEHMRRHMVENARTRKRQA